MHKSMIRHLALLASVLLCGTVAAQHDPQRDAVRHIAAKRFDKASETLAAADPNETETHFVHMLAALQNDRLDDAVAHAKAALESGLPLERLVAGPRDALAPLRKTEAYRQWIESHEPIRLLHGPMLGRVTATGASFWVRTARESDVRITVSTQPDGVTISESPLIKTTAAADYTAVVPMSGLQPQTSYDYQLFVDGHAIPGDERHFTTFPRQGRGAAFDIGFGGGAGYIPEWERMWDTVIEKDPIAFLMLGDNVYIDDPEHLLTHHYCYYRRQSRPEWRRLVSSRAMYSIYDDHDFGDNDCIPGPEIEDPTWKRVVWRKFRENWINPSYGGGDAQPGCWYDFYIGDVHFIMTDGRYYRTRKPQPDMLGPVQQQWLLDTLKNSQGAFKVLASPVPWSEGVKPGSRDPWDGFAEQRAQIFDFIDRHRINGVILIAADRHRSDLRITKRPNGYDLFELESSRLTNRHTHEVVKTPGLVWGYNETCSFARMRFNTGQSDPSVTFEVFDIEGRLVHSHQLLLSQISHP